MLKGKTAVITGGTRGIGKAIAKKFAENGADIAVVATTDNDRARETIKELQNLGVKARLYTCNIRDAEEVGCVKEEILADFSKVDILVNNAGVTRDNLLPGLSIMDIDDVIDINLKGTMFMTRAFIRDFVKNRSGNVINISSVVGLMGNKGQTNYAASKAGVVGLTKSVAKEYGRKNIRCNAIAPGFIETDMTGSLSDTQKSEVAGNIPLTKMGKPEDVANVALFLASDMSGYITGETIKVDGGMYV